MRQAGNARREVCNSLGMRADFILPIVLGVALVAMTLFATSDDAGGPTLQTTPVSCNVDAPLVSLRGLAEASGLAISGHDAQLLWSHNDSAEPYVYAVNADGSIRDRVRVAGASVKDWEAMSTAPCAQGTCFFIGDIGDNDGARQSIMIYRTSEPSPAAEATADATAIEGVYPEGAQDAEAMFVAGGQLFVVTKGEGAPVRLYRFPSLDGGRHTLQLVATLMQAPRDKMFRVTDAALSPDERWVALRTNDLLLFYDRHTLLQGAPGTPLAFDLRTLGEPQGEGLTWADAHTLYLAGEGEGAGTLARLSCNLPG